MLKKAQPCQRAAAKKENRHDSVVTAICKSLEPNKPLRHANFSGIRGSSNSEFRRASAAAVLGPLCALLGAFRRHLGLSSHAVRILHFLSGVLEDDRLSFDSGAAIADIRNKHVRKRVELAAGAAFAVDGNLGTVHVHLTVANEVEPRPSKQGLAGWCSGGDVEVVGVLHGAATEIGVDDLEGLAVVVAEGDLAGSSFVAGVSSQSKVVLLTGLVGSNGLEWVLMVAFAGEVGAYNSFSICTFLYGM